MDCSPTGSSIHGILQARILEWVAISVSRGSSRPRDRTQVSCSVGRCFTLWATREAQYTEPEAKMYKNVYFIVPLNWHITLVLMFESKTVYLVFFYSAAVNRSSTQNCETHMSRMWHVSPLSSLIVYLSQNEINLPMSSCCFQQQQSDKLNYSIHSHTHCLI